MGQKKRAAGPTSWKVSVVELENLFVAGKSCQALRPVEPGVDRSRSISQPSSPWITPCAAG
jgi:hypothetical protein